MRVPGTGPGGVEAVALSGTVAAGCAAGADVVAGGLEGSWHAVIKQRRVSTAPIAKALVDAHKRGVKVFVILDKSQRTEKYSSADFVRNAGIPTYIDAKHAIAHNKVMVIDSKTVLTGSFNFTKAAEENNAENLLVIQDPALAAKYAANWQTHYKHSEVYQGKGK